MTEGPRGREERDPLGREDRLPGEEREPLGREDPLPKEERGALGREDPPPREERRSSEENREEEGLLDKLKRKLEGL
jgi:hypothetical protein